MNTIYKRIYDGLKQQYLAHIIRSMESYLRVVTKNPMFQINCHPLSPHSPVLNVGCAQYFPKRFFTIFYHPAMDDKQLRVCLAHELGHLFLIESINVKKEEAEKLSAMSRTEPLSSIFGILAIMDRNDFYEHCREFFNHDTWEGIIHSFKNLNR